MPPSTVRPAFVRARLGAETADGWTWAVVRLGEQELDELKFLIRAMDRSLHIGTETP